MRQPANDFSVMKPAKLLLLCLALFQIPALALAQSPGASENANSTDEQPANTHEFYFTRGIYSGEFEDYDLGGRWAVDYPKADRQFLVALKRLSIVDAWGSDNAIELTDPNLRRFPFLYAVEVGSMSLNDAEVLALRDYLLAGGLLVIDDFWGSWAWEQFVSQMQKVFPERVIVDVPPEHPIFHIFYNIDDLVQVPNLRQGWGADEGGPTHEYDGYVPRLRGIFDDDGRLMVLINWNTDLGDAWEWADNPHYPLRFSTYAFEMGINFVIYGLTH